jgi:hypothetical protein
VETKRLLEDSIPFVKHTIKQDQYLNIRDSRISNEETIVSNPVNVNDNPVKTTNNEKTNLNKLFETLELKINEMYITFCEETGLNLQPLAILKFQLNGRVSNWTKNLHLKVGLN